MKFISALAVAFLAGTSAANVFEAKKSANSAKSKYMNNMMTGAKVLRALDAEAEADLSSYSIMFEKCQFVKAFSEELAAEGGDTVLATQRFVIFKLCPTSADSCNYNYGEYLVDMDTFLQNTVEYKQEEQDEMCNTCEEYCQADEDEAEDEEAEEEADENEDGDERRRRLAAKKFTRKLADAVAVNVDCDTCTQSCEKIANMQDNNYIDATYFINCERIVDEGDDQVALYAGPMCGSQGSKIKIGVFEDEDCMFLNGDLDVEDYLADEDGYGLKLSHALLKTTYDNSDPIQCEQEDENADENNYYDANAVKETKEVCRNVYDAAAKCEEEHDFQNGVDKYYAENANQVDNEELVCSYIYSLKSGTYSQDGEIVIGGSPSYSPGGTSTTGGQKFALTFFILGTVGLAVYAAMLHSQLTKGGKADLSTQGGAMA